MSNTRGSNRSFARIYVIKRTGLRSKGRDSGEKEKEINKLECKFMSRDSICIHRCVRRGVYRPCVKERKSVSRKTNFNFRGNKLQIEACCESFGYLVISSGLTAFRRLNNNQIYVYRVSQEECARLRESVPYVKLYRYNPKHLYPKLNGYGDNCHRKVWASGVSTYCTPSVTPYSSTAHARQRETTS